MIDLPFLGEGVHMALSLADIDSVLFNVGQAGAEARDDLEIEQEAGMGDETEEAGKTEDILDPATSKQADGDPGDEQPEPVTDKPAGE